MADTIAATTDISDVVKEYFGIYAAYVIEERAIPDIRDGLKPVQRRIIYAAWEMGAKAPRKYVKSAKIVGNCFLEGELVHLSNGIKPIEKVKLGDLVVLPNGKTSPVTKTYKNPPSQMIKIYFDNGNHLTVTKGQLFKVLNKDMTIEWIEAQNLNQNHQLLMSTYKTHFPQKNINPKSMKSKNAYVLGFLAAEGGLTDRGRSTRIVANSIDKELIDFVEDYCKEKKYKPCRSIQPPQKEHHSKQYRVRVSGTKDLYDVCKDLHNYKRVPSKILKDKNLFAPFIAGFVDGDGYIRIEKSAVVFTSTSEELLRDISCMMSYWGIQTHISQTETDHKDRFNIFVDGERARMLLKIISPYLVANRKSKIAKKNISTDLMKHDNVGTLAFESIPIGCAFESFSEKHLGSGWFKDANGEKFRDGIKTKSGCKIRYSKDLKNKNMNYRSINEYKITDKLKRIGNEELANNIEEVIKNYCVCKVNKIEKVKNSESYDIQIKDKSHAFLVRGFVVHNCMGSYHPHGDKSIYDTMVRMTQEFNMRIPLFDGQGNFGSIDGDPPAAQRYTECRLFQIAQDIFCNNLNDKVVRFVPNYDGTTTEPEVLPAELPHLLLNYNQGIAVGIASTIHSCCPQELIDCLIGEIDNGWITTHSEFAPKNFRGPDLATKGIIEFDKDEANNFWLTGKSKWQTRGDAVNETDPRSGLKRIVINSLPFQQQKDKWLADVATLVVEKDENGLRKIDGIADMRDESNKDGVRIVFDLQRSASPDVVLNLLYKKTNLQQNINTNMVALVDKKSKYVGVREVLLKWLDFRRVCVTNTLKKEKKELEDRVEIIDGLLFVHDHLDEVIKVIRSSENAKDALIEKFKLTDMQATSITQMRLGSLRKIDQAEILTEKEVKIGRIEEITIILADPKKLDALIKDRLLWWKEELKGRNTRVVKEFEAISILDTIVEEDVVVSINSKDEVRLTPVHEYRKTKRGGSGVKETKDSEDSDGIPRLLAQVTTHDMLYAFTDQCRVFERPCHELPLGKRAGKTIPLKELYPDLNENERVVDILAMNAIEMDERESIIFLRANGTVKRLSCRGLVKKRGRLNGDFCCRTDNDDSKLIGVCLAPKDSHLICYTKNGLYRRIDVDSIRMVPTRASGTVNCFVLVGDDEVIGLDSIKTGDSVVSVSELGFGARFKESELSFKKGRTGKGMKLCNCDDKAGKLVCGCVVSGEDELFLTTSGGKSLRMAAADIRETGRGSRGVKLQKLKDDEKVVAMTKIKDV